jgi:hypothetical protein
VTACSFVNLSDSGRCLFDLVTEGKLLPLMAFIAADGEPKSRRPPNSLACVGLFLAIHGISQSTDRRNAQSGVSDGKLDRSRARCGSSGKVRRLPSRTHGRSTK